MRNDTEKGPHYPEEPGEPEPERRGGGGPVGPRGARGPTNPRALIGYLFLSVGIVLAFGFTWQQGQKLERATAENTKATEALCTLRADLASRVASSNELLEDHPEGDIFGIPRELIISGRDNQQETFDALDILECPSRPSP